MQIRKLSWLLLSLTLLLQATSAGCPVGCVCSDSTCQSCQTGYFNAALNPADTPICLQCLPGCSSCNLNQSNKLICSACLDDWKLDSENGNCFQCDPKCQSCGEKPDICPTCNPPFVSLSDLQGVDRCFADPYCPPGCATCAQSESIIGSLMNGEQVAEQTIFDNTCESCMPGNFKIVELCFRCSAGCSNCDLDEEALWTDQVEPFWTSAFGLVQTEVSFDPDTISDVDKQLWTISYFLFKFIEQKTGTTNQISAESIETLYGFKQILDREQRLEEMADFVNGMTTQYFTDKKIKEHLMNQYQMHSVCSDCYEGYKMNTQTDMCEKCKAGCTSCDDSGCLSCAQGLYLDGTACTECDPSCEACDGAGDSSCTKCQLPLSLSGTKCVECNDPCRTCDVVDIASCLTCKIPYNLQANEGICHLCDDRNCAQCSSDQIAGCEKCREGYVLIEGSCEICPQDCMSCGPGPTTLADNGRDNGRGQRDSEQDSDDSSDDDDDDDSGFICYQCLEGYYLDPEDQQCQSCSKGCQKCNMHGECLECRRGYYFNKEEGNCLKCEKGCKECNEVVCLRYQSGHVIYGGDVVECDPGCDECDSTNVNTCFDCDDGFWLDGGICKSCITGCEECSDSTGCEQCKKGFFWDSDSSACMACSNGCKSCSDENTCTKCLRGYSLENNACVKNCEDDCIRCNEADTSECLQCKPGYALTDEGHCNKCASKCSGSCDPNDRTSCTECGDGFRKQGDECKRCPQGTAQCTETDAIICIEGFELEENEDGNDVCVRYCPSPCKKCQSDGECEKCMDGYDLEDEVCVLDEDELCSADCDFCPLGSELLEDNTCRICSTEGCHICEEDICQICRPGMYRDGSDACVACSESCKTCFDGETCEICADGYFKEIVSMDQGLEDAVFADTCSVCDQNCKTCAIEADRCLSCHKGYRMTKGSNVCVGRFTVGLYITYEAAFEDFDTEGQITSIIAHLGIEKRRLLINDIRSGSTIFDAEISADSEQNAIELQSSAEDTSGLTNGASIQSFTATVYQDDSVYEGSEEEQEEHDSKANVGLIIGVIIAGLILIIVAIVFLVKIRGKKTQGHYNVKNGSEGQFEGETSEKNGNEKLYV